MKAFNTGRFTTFRKGTERIAVSGSAEGSCDTSTLELTGGNERNDESGTNWTCFPSNHFFSFSAFRELPHSRYTRLNIRVSSKSCLHGYIRSSPLTLPIYFMFREGDSRKIEMEAEFSRDVANIVLRRPLF